MTSFELIWHLIVLLLSTYEYKKPKEVISKLREVHPYEEPAIDIVPLIDESCFK
ncbi:MAG: hypothetical protein HFJ40_06285 [Clostridia bacterium]|nr:hypothetical protein [Clostridia bacterium]